MRIKYLPPDAALWGLVRKDGQEPRERPGNVVSIADFVGRNRKALRGGEGTG